MIGLEDASRRPGRTDWLPAAARTEDGRPRPEAQGVGADASGEPRNDAGMRAFSMVAHELRGPLMALATSSELLVEDFDRLPQTQVREMVAGIHGRALWLQGLVENLLAAATLQEGRLHLHIQPTSLIEVVREVQQVVQPLLNRRGQQLRVRPRGRLPEVPADSRRIGQVLVNLVLNASKFSPDGTAIEVTLSSRGGGILVSVLDRGPGLPEGLAERLFEPFYRAPTTENQEGIGLGLAIVKSIVERHGGRVGAEDRPEGGARFWFELPGLPG
jgi:two-component system, OmpR family, sensor histidine kinase KdpD